MDIINPTSRGSSATPIRSEFADDPEFRELLELFRDSMRENQHQMRSLFSQGEYLPLSRLAHQVKGSGGGYGFPDLTPLAADLESCCKGEEPTAISASLSRLCEFLDRIEI